MREDTPRRTTVSSRTRLPEREELDWDEPPSRRPPPPRTPRRAPRTVALPIAGGAVLLALLVGFLANSGGGGTTTITETRTVTAPSTAAAPSASGEASRADIALAILNGSDESGLAGRTAAQAQGLGYELVSEGNAPEPESTDRVLYRQGAAAKARQVAEDLGLPAPTRLAADDAIASVEPGAEVIVALGPTGAVAPTTGEPIVPDEAAGTPPADAVTPEAAAPEADPVTP